MWTDSNVLERPPVFGVDGSLEVKGDRDQQFHAWTYVFVPQAKTVMMLATGEVTTSLFLNGGFDAPITPAQGDATQLNLIAGWNRIDVTGYHQHQGYLFNLSGLAEQVDFIDSHASFGEGINPGDCNLDLRVDTVDFNILAGHFGSSTDVTWLIGDFNQDGAVESIDFGLMVANFGRTGTASSFASAPMVPEPIAFGALLAAQLLLMRQRLASPRKCS